MNHKINIMSGQTMPLPQSDRRVSIVDDGDFALAHLVSIRRQGGLGDVLTHLLDGRDCMLVPIRRLDDVALRLVRIGRDILQVQGEVGGREDIIELGQMQCYLDGIVHARLCQIAAGIEPAAA